MYTNVNQGDLHVSEVLQTAVFLMGYVIVLLIQLLYCMFYGKYTHTYNMYVIYLVLKADNELRMYSALSLTGK